MGRYMRSSDDDWIMVEDEFLSTAQLYTRSVHRQEYQRLQLEAASKNAGKISSIQRPVTGKAVLSGAGVRGRALSRSALDGSSEEEEEEEEEGGVGSKTGRGKSDLMMLMRAETGSQASLSMLMPQKKVATRAAAGYTDSQVSSHKRSLASIHNQQNAEPAVLAKSSGMAAVRKPVYAAPASATSTDEDDYGDDLDAPVASHGRHSRNRSRQPTSALALASPKVALSLDSDDDLDAPVMRHRRRFVASPRRPAPMPPPASTRPPAVRAWELERSVEAAARPPPPPPPKTPLLLDSDEDLSSLMPKQLPGSRFKGRSMAARERAIKDAG